MPTQPLPESRHLLRQETLRRREAAPAAHRQEKSTVIAKRVLELPCVDKAQTIFTYVNFRSEV